MIAQPSEVDGGDGETRTPTSLTTVTMSACWPRSTSSPPSVSGASPRAVAIASRTASTHQHGADDVREHLRADRVGEADLEGGGVEDGVDADHGQQRGEAVLAGPVAGGRRRRAAVRSVVRRTHSSPSSSSVSATRASCSSRNASKSSPVRKASIQPFSSSACCHASLSCISCS